MLVTKQWLKVTVLAVFIVSLFMSALAFVPATHAADGDVRIALRGSAQYPNAKGTAKYRDRGGEQEFQVELENARSLAGKTVDVYANGVKVGSFRVSALGTGRLNRNSDRGQNVPDIHAGSVVQIKTRAGVLIVSGSF